jgi:hypothetical protein
MVYFQLVHLEPIPPALESARNQTHFLLRGTA